jgi:zinc transporter, ZIP family
MSDWISIFLLTFLAGLAMVLGALIAMIEKIESKWLEKEFRHAVIAFGGGVLVSAIALVLVHEGMRNLTIFPVAVYFGMGGVFFMFIDMFLNKHKENVSQLAAMLLDFIPEVIALGVLYLLNRNYAFLLGLLIIMQNIPEGFNAYRELKINFKYKRSKIILVFFAMSFIGPIAGLLGYFFLTESPQIVSAIMLFASGGILYLVFQDIAPQAKLKHHWAPSLGAVAGFLFGMIGKMLIIK